MYRIPEGRTERVGCVLAVAMVAAPFLALLYGPDAGLVVAAAALTATAFVAREAARAADGPGVRRMTVAAAVNALLAAGMVAVLVLRRFGW